MLTLHLTPIFKARGIEKPYAFLVKAGFSPHIANNLSQNKSIVLNLNHLEKLCRIFCCEPNDLFLWEQDKKYPVGDNHPLQKLSMQETVKRSAQEILANMPLQQLKELTKSLDTKTRL